jgi:hypothetical protein
VNQIPKYYFNAKQLMYVILKHIEEEYKININLCGNIFSEKELKKAQIVINKYQTFLKIRIFNLFDEKEYKQSWYAKNRESILQKNKEKYKELKKDTIKYNEFLNVNKKGSLEYNHSHPNVRIEYMKRLEKDPIKLAEFKRKKIEWQKQRSAKGKKESYL